MLGQRTQPTFAAPPESYSSTPLFDDTSGYSDYNMAQQPETQQQTMFPGQTLINDPMASMAVQYGSQMADSGKEFVGKKVRII